MSTESPKSLGLSPTPGDAGAARTKRSKTKTLTPALRNSVPGLSSLNGSDGGSLEQWESLRQKTMRRGGPASAETVFGKAAKSGSVYRWGIAVAKSGPCDPVTQTISRLACGGLLAKIKKSPEFDLVAETQTFIDSMESTNVFDVLTATQVVTWAAALPELCRELAPELSWRLVTSLRQLHEAVVARANVTSAAHLILAGELGLTLAWRLADVPSCLLLRKPAVAAMTAWCEQSENSVADAVAGAVHARAVLASVVRCESLMQVTAKQKFKKVHIRAADVLATWVAALTVRKGGSVFSSATRKDAMDDLIDGGLFDRAVTYDSDTLEPAIAAVLGESQTGGRLAWEVSLPESMWHEPDAKLAVMLPEWDVQKSRVCLDYSGENVAIEIFSGRTKVIDGQWQTMIELDGDEQQPTGPWTEICEYSDDDVHYIEMEQPWTGGLLLQRQIMLVREDRCILAADAVVPTDQAIREASGAPSSQVIRYMSRLPMAESIAADPEPETREVFLSDGRRAAMVLPISACEWRVGPTAATLKSSEDGHLVFTSEGKGRLYSPLWIDCSQRRFKRKRTWRQLTVVDELRLCRNDEAVGYRIQVGSEQWMVYRTLGQPRTRSVLGKHLIADFFASRFDLTYGDHDALVTVDDSEPGSSE
ncbi:hypothetical protein [Rubripirellula tenax]|nr:hypothetical protein [Rubripirellula tenax]